MRVSIASLCVLLYLTGQALAETLITEDEARLPQSDLQRRSIYLGPTIEVISPKQTTGEMRSPFRLTLKFKAHGGAKVDIDTLTITYVKNPTVDLTSRIVPHSNAEGILMPDAEVPPGTHRLWVDVQDTNGETGAIELILRVSK
jgi:hypothetical protein